MKWIGAWGILKKVKIKMTLRGGERPCVVSEVSSFVYWWGSDCSVLWRNVRPVPPSSSYPTHVTLISSSSSTSDNTSSTASCTPTTSNSIDGTTAFGSLYSHPLEGFLLDTLGAVIAEWATGLSTQQAMPLFSVSSLKTVDDHYGYNSHGTRYRCLGKQCGLS